MQEQWVDVRERVREVEFLLGAMRESLAAGGEYLAERRHPNGPICHDRNLSYMHKAAWGMYAAGVSPEIVTELLDWAAEEALQPNGDFFFPEEEPQYRVMQRVYRPLTFLKVAVWLDHPLASNRAVIERIFQYQHSSGGTFNYIGEDPARVEQQATLGTLNSSFFGHLMVALGERERALVTGDFLRRFVELNRAHLRQGRFYTQMTPAGELVTDVAPGQRYSHVVQASEPKQEFWQTGTTMAYLAVLYEVVRERWGGEEEARPYLDAALELLAFDAAMPLEGYLWPSKCKVGWGAGELLRVMVKYGLGTAGQVEDAYQVARKVAVHTFIGNQLPHGGWSAMHYPLSELDPEFRLSYVPLRGRVHVPQVAIEGFSKLFLPAEELTGECLGEMEAIYRGMAAYRERLQ
ncbi:MAG: hypothetical protein HPY83_00145 [Anaerolineae bacterium]|nr:hypothetical protein [Anaerolineae bacterium]